MGDVSKATNLCSVCAQPSRLNCAKCKVPYCSVACQTGCEDAKAALASLRA